MSELGCPQEAVDRSRCLEIEPALAASNEGIAGGIYCPADEIGDAHKFTTALAGIAADLGVDFRYGADFTGFRRTGTAISHAETDAGPMTADAFVLALGSFSARPARRIGLNLPVYPIKGYSVTVPITDPAAAPRIGLADDSRRLVLAPLGSRLRAAGTAETAGFDNRPNPVRGGAILDAARAMFPGAGDYSQAEHWSGLRPTTPDSVPILGRTRYANLYLNTGHGTLGWTHACGSGRVTADLISGRDPGIDLDGLTIDRF
jgi:D-amino-acid dehydrogenase